MRPARDTHDSVSGRRRRARRDGAPMRIPPLRKFLSQLLGHRNFWLWVVINLIQVFNCHYNSNFMAIFLDAFLPAASGGGSGDRGEDSSWNTFSKAGVLSLTAVLPHVCVILCAGVIARLGVWKLLRRLYTFKLLSALCELLLGLYVGLHLQRELGNQSSAAMLFVFFVLLNKVSNEVSGRPHVYSPPCHSPTLALFLLCCAVARLSGASLCALLLCAVAAEHSHPFSHSRTRIRSPTLALAPVLPLSHSHAPTNWPLSHARTH
jgi:hypothetical protein